MNKDQETPGLIKQSRRERRDYERNVKKGILKGRITVFKDTETGEVILAGKTATPEKINQIMYGENIKNFVEDSIEQNKRNLL